MKKIFKFIPAVVAALALTACSSDDVLQSSKVTKTLTATIDGENTTRATVSGTSIFWTDGDAFKVFDNASNSDTYTITTGSGTATGDFGTTDNNVSEGNETYAIYPAGNATSISSDVLTFTLADSYALATQSISGSDLMKTVIPMWSAYATDLSFKHLGAVMQCNLKDLPVGSEEIILSSAAQNLSGTFTATLTDDEPVLAYASDGGKTVSVTFDKTTAKEDKQILVPLPVGTYDLTVSVKVDGTTKEIKTWDSFTFKRKKLYRATLTYVEIAATKPSDVTTALSDNVEAGKKVEVVITGTGVTSESADKTITVPDVNNTDVELTFENAVAGTTESDPLTVTDGTTDASTASKNELTITQPDASDVYMDINLPKTTVTLETSGTATTYKTIRATTASNTLVIGKGVTVEKLIVKGGNVVIENGGSVTAIEYDSEIAQPWAGYKEADGKKYYTLYASVAKALAGKATQLKLLKDFTDAYIYMTSGDLTIDLDGKTLSLSPTTYSYNYNWGIYLNPASDINFTINAGDGGKVVFADNLELGIYATSGDDDQQHANITLNGGTYEFGSGVKIGVQAFSKNGNVTINNATLTSTYVGNTTNCLVYIWGGTGSLSNTTITTEAQGCLYAGGAGYYKTASDHTFDYLHATVNVSNCTMTNKQHVGSGYAWCSTALAVSEDAVLTVDGGTYTGYTAAAYVFSSGGTINLKSGSYKGTTYCLASDWDEASYGAESKYKYNGAYLYYSSSCTFTGTNKSSNGTIAEKAF